MIVHVVGSRTAVLPDLVVDDDVTRVSLQLQQGFSTGSAAVSHDVTWWSMMTHSYSAGPPTVLRQTMLSVRRSQVHSTFVGRNNSVCELTAAVGILHRPQVQSTLFAPPVR